MQPSKKFKYEFIFAHPLQNSSLKSSQVTQQQSINLIGQPQSQQKEDSCTDLMPKSTLKQVKQLTIPALQLSSIQVQRPLTIQFAKRKKANFHREKLGSVNTGYLPIKNNNQLKYKSKLLTCRTQIRLRSTMTSNEKKGYQYYFKKPGTSVEKQGLPNKTDTLNQPYIKYQKYQKLKQSTFISSCTNRNHKYQHSHTYTLEKNGPLYQSVYERGKGVTSKQPGVGVDKGKKSKSKSKSKQKMNFGLPMNQPREMQHGMNFQRIHKMKEMNQNDNDSQHLRVLSNQNSLVHLPCQQKNTTQPQIQHPKQTDSQLRSFHQIDQGQKHRQLGQLLDTTSLNNSRSSWNEQRLGYSQQKPHYIHTQSSQQFYGKQDYFTELQKFREKLRNEGMKISTLITENDSLKESVELTDVKRSTKCGECSKIGERLIASEMEIAEMQKKQLLTNEQVHRQQKYIKELQDNDYKARQQLQKKEMQLGIQRKRIQVLQTLQRQLKQSLQLVKQQHKSQMESELQKMNQYYDFSINKERQMLEQQRKNSEVYLSCISKLNQKIEQIDQQNSIIFKDLGVRYERELEAVINQCQQETNRTRQGSERWKKESEKMRQQIERMRQLTENKKLQIEGVRQQIERVRKQGDDLLRKRIQQMSTHHQQQIKQIIQIHTNQINQLIHSHQSNISLLNQQLLQLKTYSQQVPYLTEVIVKLELEMMQRKTSRQQIVKRNDQLQERLSKSEKKCKDTQQRNTAKQSLHKQTTGNIKQLHSHRDTLLKERKINWNLIHSEYEVQELSLTHDDRINQTFLQQSESISPSTSSLSHSLKSRSIEKRPQQFQQQRQLQMQQKVINDLKQCCAESQQRYQLSIKQTNEKSISSKQLKRKPSQEITQKLSLQITEKLSLQMKEQFSQQIQVKETQLFSNVKYIEEMDEKLAQLVMVKEKIERECLERVQSMEKKHKEQMQLLGNKLQVYQTVIDGKDQEIAMCQVIINDLKDRIISYDEKLNKMNIIAKGSSDSLNQQQLKEIQVLTEQLQSKEFQLNQLSYQLQQSLQLINLLKQQLQQRDTHSSLKLPSNSQHSKQQKQDPLSHKTNSNKQTILREYFTKIEQYYNEVLEVFGLELVTHEMLNAESMVSPLMSPRLRNKSVEKGQAAMDRQKNQEDDLTAFQHQEVECNSPTNINTQQTPYNNTSPQILSPPSSALQQAFMYLSSNQQQVLRIINQWIRKLQRQSLSIHQYKEKCLFLQQNISQISQENTVLSEEKLEICDKYEVFISKLEAENNMLEDKSHQMTNKLIEVEIYVKQLEELMHETNKQCMRSGIAVLELQKQYTLEGKLVNSELRNIQNILMNDNNYNNELGRKSYFQQFYEQHSTQSKGICMINSENQQQVIGNLQEQVKLHS